MSGEPRSSAELVAVQVALARGWLQEQDLREVMSLRQRLQRSGEERGLLALLSESRLEAAQVEELRGVYEQALRVAEGEGPPSAPGRTRAGGSDLGPVHDAPTRGPARPPSGRTPAAPGAIGRYQLTSLLGRGGMGTVWRAWDPELQREVALKLLAPDADALEDRERLRREARAAAGLRHPHLVRVLDLDLAHEPPYLVMDLVEGESLKALLQRQGPLAPRAAAELTRKLASALAAAHAHGLVHRDVKPANVLLDAAGEPALTDFGLVRRVEGEEQRLTKSGDVLGTPTYMSPEQARGDRQADRRSDVWSLGAVLYHLLTGRPPFLEASVIGQIKALLQRDPEPPSRHRPDVPPGLEAIVLRCLRRAPAARYADAGELEQDLTAWLAADARGQGPPFAAVAAVLLLALGALGAVGVLVLRPAAAPAAGQPSPPPAAAPGGPASGPGAAELRAQAERLHAQGATIEAIAALGSALLLEPRDPDALARRGELRLGAGDPRGADVDLSAALDLDPHSLRCRRLRGRVRLGTDPAQGLRDLEVALDLARQGPFAAEVRAELLCGLVREGRRLMHDDMDCPAAQRLARRALELDPDDPGALVLLAEACVYLSDAEGARVHAERALADPGRLQAAGLSPGQALWVRAMGHLLARQLAPALRDFDAALAALPPGAAELPRVLALRGQARLVSGDPAGALADAEAALVHLPPGHPERPGAESLRRAALRADEGRARPSR